MGCHSAGGCESRQQGSSPSRVQARRLYVLLLWQLGRGPGGAQIWTPSALSADHHLHRMAVRAYGRARHPHCLRRGSLAGATTPFEMMHLLTLVQLSASCCVWGPLRTALDRANHTAPDVGEAARPVADAAQGVPDWLAGQHGPSAAAPGRAAGQGSARPCPEQVSANTRPPARPYSSPHSGLQCCDAPSLARGSTSKWCRPHSANRNHCLSIGQSHWRMLMLPPPGDVASCCFRSPLIRC